MLNFKKIELADKKILDPYFNKIDCNLLNYSFEIQFIYRNFVNFEYAFFEEFLLVKVNFDNHEKFLYPIGEGDISRAFDAISEYALKRFDKFSFFQFCENRSKTLLQWAENFKTREKIRYDFLPARSEFEYIYKSEDLATLNGHQLKKKRNLVNQFLKLYVYEIETITSGKLDDIRKFDAQWNEFKNIDSKSRLVIENKVLEEVFRYYDELNLQGIMLKVEGEIVAFAIGCPLHDDTFLILFEKANVKYKGVYAMINQSFAKIIAENYTYINREEDCGYASLRKAKLSYAPVKMNEVYYLTIQKL